MRRERAGPPSTNIIVKDVTDCCNQAWLLKKSLQVSETAEIG